MKNIVIPVGCTGYMAKELWNEVNSHPTDYYENVNDEVKEVFNSLNSKTTNEKLVNNIIKLINLLRRN